MDVLALPLTATSNATTEKDETRDWDQKVGVCLPWGAREQGNLEMGLEDWTGSDWEKEGKGLGFGVWGAPAPAPAPANGRRLPDRARYKLQVQTSSKYEVRGYGGTIGLERTDCVFKLLRYLE